VKKSVSSAMVWRVLVAWGDEPAMGGGWSWGIGRDRIFFHV